MSEMHIGATPCKATCKSCGLSVDGKISYGISTGRNHIGCDPHDAPCGLPCFGGGVSTTAVREGRAAGKRNDEVGHTSDRCPRCRTPAEILAARIDEIGRSIRADVKFDVDEMERLEIEDAFGDGPDLTAAVDKWKVARR